MRNESCPSISSKSAVSNRMLAIALLSTDFKINQSARREWTRRRLALKRNASTLLDGTGGSVRRERRNRLARLPGPTELLLRSLLADLSGPQRCQTPPDRPLADSC